MKRDEIIEGWRFITCILRQIYKNDQIKKMNMRFGTWNVRSMYRAGLLRTVAEEISNIS
jgi:hypothetical protein